MRFLHLLLLLVVSVLPAHGQIVINEFNTGTPEFVEIRNLSVSQTVNVGGYTVESYQASGGTPAFEGSYTLPASIMLGPREEFVLEENGTAGAPTASFTCGVRTGYNYNWTNTRNIILILRDASNQPLDYVYRNDAGGAGGAPSLPAGLAWSGTFSASGNACSRLTDVDNNSANDWTVNSAASACADTPGQPALPPPPPPIQLLLTTTGVGDIIASVVTMPALPGAEFWNLVSFQNNGGNGPLFGIGLDALPQIAAPTGTIFHNYLSPTGAWSFNGAPGSVMPGLYVEVVTVAVNQSTVEVVWSSVVPISF